MTDDEGFQIAARPLTWSEYQAANRIAAQDLQVTLRNTVRKDLRLRLKYALTLWILVVFFAFIGIESAQMAGSTKNIMGGLFLLFFLGGGLSLSIVGRMSANLIVRLQWAKHVDQKLSRIVVNKDGVNFIGENAEFFRRWITVESCRFESGFVAFLPKYYLDVIPATFLQNDNHSQIVDFANQRILASKWRMGGNECSGDVSVPLQES